MPRRACRGVGWLWVATLARLLSITKLGTAPPGRGRTRSLTATAELAEVALGGEDEAALWTAAARSLQRALAAEATAALQRDGTVRASTGDADLCFDGHPNLTVPVGQLGTLMAASRRPRAFRAADVRCATLVADVLALGIGLRHAADELRRERRRIASDIHDDPVQALATAAIELNLVAAHVDGEAGGRIAAARDNVAHATRSLRRVMSNLLPDVLEREGLEAAVRDHLARICDPSGIAWSLESALDDEPADAIRLGALRVAQEAVANARTHGRPARIDVSLATVDGGLELRVADDGVGFDPAGASPSTDHHGLRSMRERASGLGGRLEVTSRPGHGTVVACRLPA
jgi:signal transduction histidine kinase